MLFPITIWNNKNEFWYNHCPNNNTILFIVLLFTHLVLLRRPFMPSSSAFHAFFVGLSCLLCRHFRPSFSAFHAFFVGLSCLLCRPFRPSSSAFHALQNFCITDGGISSCFIDSSFLAHLLMVTSLTLHTVAISTLDGFNKNV